MNVVKGKQERMIKFTAILIYLASLPVQAVHPPPVPVITKLLQK